MSRERNPGLTRSPAPSSRSSSTDAAGPTYDVFLSHATDDKPTVEDLVRRLREDDESYLIWRVAWPKPAIGRSSGGLLFDLDQLG